MNTTATTPKTQNEAWGFFGTISTSTDHATANPAWDIASQEIARTTGADANAVRAFLDSRDGRHFADDVIGAYQILQRSPTPKADDMTTAIRSATAKWMAWSIDRRISRDTGIPAGLPYLTGFVIDAGIQEAAAEHKAT